VVERGSLSWSPMRRGGLGMGALTGAAIFAVVLGGGLLLAPVMIDAAAVKEAAQRTGLDQPWRFMALAGYWITINSMIEEYVFRWFCQRQCERLVRDVRIAAVLSGLCFTIHHVVALRMQFPWGATLLGSLGVFVGGTIWSAMYAKYRSIWPGYLSHAMVDVAVYIVGWKLIYGA